MDSEHTRKVCSWDQVSITWCTPPVGGQGARSLLLFAAYAASYRRLLCGGGLNVGEVLKSCPPLRSPSIDGVNFRPHLPPENRAELWRFSSSAGQILPCKTRRSSGVFRPALFLGTKFHSKTRVNYGLFDPAKSAKVAGTLGLHLSIPMIRGLSMSSLPVMIQGVQM